MKNLVHALAALAAMLCAAIAGAADLKVLASNGVRATLEELAPAFERETGHKLAVTYGVAAVLKRQIEAGEAFDLAILTSGGIEDLATQGKVDGASRTPIARSGVGVAVRAGAPKPDIGSTEALKRALLSAKSITWTKEGASGVYFASVVQKLGIAEQLAPKLNLAASGAQVGEKIVAGEAELGALLVNEIMALKGVDLAGPLPPELQSYTVFHSGVSTASKNTAAAKALAHFLTTPAAAALFKSKGQEPG
ncbi:MAG TPA: substrate-binding domain-containing protein [Burkholderiales bacterium]|nr:substrate-binding domain-containing protein [Burkholderiales bacterium]